MAAVTSLTPELVKVYSETVEEYARLALSEFNRLQEIVADLHHDLSSHPAFWVRLQSFVGHAGMVSKFLFPTAKDPLAVSRGRQLCASLGVTTSSPLAARAARNATEHIDERMDDWVRSDSDGILNGVMPGACALTKWRAEGLVGGPAGATLGGMTVQRLFFIEDMTFVTPGRSDLDATPLLPLRDELQRIVAACDKHHAKQSEDMWSDLLDS